MQSAGKYVDETPDVWKLAAIASFSVLAVVLVGAVLIIGVMVHRRKSHRRPLRGETHTGARVADAAPARTAKGSSQALEATFGQECVKFWTGGAVSVEISSEVEESFKDHVPGPHARCSAHVPFRPCCCVSACFPALF